MRVLLVLVVLVTLVPTRGVRAQSPHPAPALKTRNVFLVMLDGLRWQEVFSGADEALISKENHVADADAVKRTYWRDTPEERRAVLMPFFWTTIASQGQVFGNRYKASEADVTNGIGVSYPGYAETLCGFAEPAIKGNNKVWNPNPTVLEWLHGQPEFRGRVAAFGAWDMFSYIFNTERCEFPVDNGCGPITRGKLTPVIETMNRVRAETPYRWGGAAFDSMVFIPAMEWIRANKPRAVFLGLGETDEWGHECRYGDYLNAATRADRYLQELWTTIQSIPEYADQTSLIVCPDHGRGDVRGPEPAQAHRDWCNHGPRHPGSDAIWIAVLGPDTPALGERMNCPRVTQSQVASTLAALVGKDFQVAEPKAGAVLPWVIHPQK